MLPLLLGGILLVTLPLLLLDCIRRDSKSEKTVLPFSNVEPTAPPTATSTREVVASLATVPPAAEPLLAEPPPPPHLPQPASDGAKDAGGTSTTKRTPGGTSTTKRTPGADHTTEKGQTPSAGSTEKLPPARAHHSHVQRRSRSRDRSWSHRKDRTPRQAYLTPEPSDKRRHSPTLTGTREQPRPSRSRDQSHRKDRTPQPAPLAPEPSDKKRHAPLTDTRDQLRRTARTPNRRMVTPPPGSKKSKKSRKALLPKSPSWKEVAARTRATPTQSRTDVTAAAKTPNTPGAVKSQLTAVSEFTFPDSQHKILGHVDRIIAASDEGVVLEAALATHQEVTCLDPTNPARSPFFGGEFSVWVADRVGSQAED